MHVLLQHLFIYSFYTSVKEGRKEGRKEYDNLLIILDNYACI